MSKLDLSILGYILPSLEDDLIISHIKSYGKVFWRSVNSKIVFKKKISEKLKHFLIDYRIAFIDDVDEYWISYFTKLVEESNTEYFELFLEDKKMLNIKDFVCCYKTAKLNDVDYMPTTFFKMWNTLSDWMSQYVDIEESDDFKLMYWGTPYSRIATANHFNELINCASSPYPVLTSGLYKKDFFLETAHRILKSNYWEEVKTIPNNLPPLTNIIFFDWAKNPAKPHSHEVWWKHNEENEELEYLVLIPKKKVHAIIDDPKDEHRFQFEQ